MRLQQETQTDAIQAGVIGNHGQIARTAGMQCTDQILRDAADSESAAHQGHAVLDHAAQCRRGIGIHFFRTDLGGHRAHS
jgi:hypothetical protein